MEIQYLQKPKPYNFKSNTYFQLGTSVEEAVQIVENAVLNATDIAVKSISLEHAKISLDIIKDEIAVFSYHIEKGIARFHPLSPLAR